MVTALAMCKTSIFSEIQGIPEPANRPAFAAIDSKGASFRRGHTAFRRKKKPCYASCRGTGKWAGNGSDQALHIGNGGRGDGRGYRGYGPVCAADRARGKQHGHFRKRRRSNPLRG